MKSKLNLSPVQQRAADGLSDGIHSGGVLVLNGSARSGKTAILKQLHAAHGGALLCARRYMDTLSRRGAEAMEEVLFNRIEDAMAAQDLLFIDDLHLVTRLADDNNYPRLYLLEAALTAILADILAQRKTIVIAIEGEIPWPLERRACVWQITAARNRSRGE